MKRTLLAALLALPALVLCSSDATAQCSPLGGPCFRLFGGMHQHGPLYNYGPYSGYYPFAPYGPWDSNLNYTGPRPGDQAACGGRGCGRGGHGGGGCGAGGCGAGGFGGLFARGDSGCSTCGGGGLSIHNGLGGLGAYAGATFKNVFFRSHPLAHRGKISTGCSACSAAPVGCGTPVHAYSHSHALAQPQATGGCSASAIGVGQLDSVSLVAGLEVAPTGRYVRER